MLSLTVLETAVINGSRAIPRGCSSLEKPKLSPGAGVAQVGLAMVPKLKALQAVGWLLTKIWLWGLLKHHHWCFWQCPAGTGSAVTSLEALDELQ